MLSKANVFYWTLYDFANSLVSIVFFLYFAQWVVIDQGLPDIYFNLTFSCSAFLLLITVPISGTLLDQSLRRITGLRYTTGLSAISHSLCAWFALNNQSIAALITYTAALYFYLLSFTFYTPLINDICRPEKRGAVSGYGIAANYLGQFFGLLIALPFSNGSINLFNGLNRAETLLPATIAFIIVALPMLLFFSEPKHPTVPLEIIKNLKLTLKDTKRLFAAPSIGLFLMAYFLFNDAILTASNNFPIFIQQVWGVSDQIKTYLLLGIVSTCALGGAISGLLADRFGHKKTLVVILLGWVIILPAVGLINNFNTFVVSTIFMGLWFGANWAVSRSVMSYLVPKTQNNLAFAYFGLAERASSLVGPLVWGVLVSDLVYADSRRYRLAMIAMTFFVILGLYLLKSVKSDRALAA